MSDINAAPSSTEPAVAGDNVNATEVQTQAQEASGAAVGEAINAAAQPSAHALPDQAAPSAQLASGAQASAASGDGSEGDAGNAGASPAAGQSASDTASYALGASLGGDTEVAALRAEIAALQQKLIDVHAEVAKWQTAYNDATADRKSGEPAPVHRWISLLEVKLTDLEHEARDELLDVTRQLREAL